MDNGFGLTSSMVCAEAVPVFRQGTADGATTKDGVEDSLELPT